MTSIRYNPTPVNFGIGRRRDEGPHGKSEYLQQLAKLARKIAGPEGSPLTDAEIAERLRVDVRGFPGAGGFGESLGPAQVRVIAEMVARQSGGDDGTLHGSQA